MIDVKDMNRDAFSDERKTAMLWVTFNGMQAVDSGNVISAKLQEDLADQNITIGSAFSQSFELKMRMPSPAIPLTGAYFTVETSFDGTNRAKLGKFYVNTVSTTDGYKTVSITATDRMAFLTDTYTPAIEFPATPREILADIANQYNLVLDTEISYANILIPQLYEGTVRDYIGWIAGLSGANARFNREGKLTFTWYRQIVAVYGDANLDGDINEEDITYINQNLLGSASTIEAEAILGRMNVGKAYIGAKIKDTTKAPLADVNQDGIINNQDVAEIQSYINGKPYDPTLVGTVKEYMQLLDENRIERSGFLLSASEAYTISALVSGTEESPVESGTGKAISFYNPFMTKAVLDQIAAENLPFTYLAAKISYRGCPSWEVGDVIRTEAGGNWDVPIMNQTLEFGQRLAGEIKSLGLSHEEESALRVVPDVKEVERQLPEIKKVLTDINNSLLSGEAGYMILDEEEIDGIKRLSGFKLMNTPTINPTTKGWLANKNGIGWSDDGFKTISKLGLDMANGKIYADQIAAGAIITNSFQIGDAMSFNGTTGEITFGSKVKMSWASIEDQPDIPTNLSELNNDEGFINSTAATVITNNAISTASLRADQITSGKISAERIDLNVNSNSTDRSGVISVYYGDYACGLNYNSVGYELSAGASGIAEGAIIGKGSYFTSLPALEVWSDTGANYSYVTPNEIVENGSSLSSKYAYKSHTHQDYYSSGDNIYANRLYVQGAGNISGDPNARLAASSPYQLGYASGSSRSFKHDIKPVENSELNPEKLYGIEVVQFKYNDDYLDKNDQRYGIDCIGFIAEQVNEVYPIAADCETGSPRNWEMRYLIPPMLALIQQQKKEIEQLKKQVGRLLS